MNFVLACLYTFVTSVWVVKGENNYNPLVWPLPKTFTIETEPTLSVSNDFSFDTTSDSDILKNAVQRYTRITFPHEAESVNSDNSVLTQLKITILDNSENLQYRVYFNYAIFF